MVNSPSRPNSCPPAPVECGGMTPLWNRETCLPGHRPAWFPPPTIKPNQTKSNHHPFSRISRCNLPRPQSRQKPQQSCLIKPHQGIGQIFQQPSVRPSTRWIGRTGRRMAKRVPRRNPLLGERKQVRASVITNQSLFAPPHPQSRQKPQQSCMIKAYQGIGQKHPSPWNLELPHPNSETREPRPTTAPFPD